MSIRLRELIRAVRACKTAAEERDVIAKESAALREAFREQDTKYKGRNVAKLMYIHMLGYPTHFGQMETLKLIAASGFPEKRIGYLGLMILLDERQEVLMLVTNSLKMDLNHKNQFIVGLALAALGNICSAEMARDLAPDVEKLLESANPYIRKKAALCAIRVLKKVPDLIESFGEKAAELIADKNHGVILSGVTLMLHICELDAATLESYRAFVPNLCKVLRSLLQTGFSPEHDVGGITDPFLQVQILRLLRILGKGNAEASDQMTDILAQVAANIEGNRNAGNAILYECVQTIMGIEAIGGLRVMAVNILGRFLANKDNNIRYVALNTLAKVVSVDTQAVQRHRTTIVDCVKDADVSIRRRALELVYSLVNENNIRTLTKELLDYLAVSDAEFKPDLTAKICLLIQRFAPDKRWHVDNLVQVLSQAGPYVKEEVVRAMIVLVSNAPELHGYTARSLYRAAITNTSSADGGGERSLLTAALWCLGEYGQLLTGSGAQLLEGEVPLPAADSDGIAWVEKLLARSKIDPVVKEYSLTCLIKLTARFPDQAARIVEVIKRHTGSSLLEVQQRACEYAKIFGFEHIRPQLLEPMPALDEAEYARTTGADGGGGGTGSAAATPKAVTPAAAVAPAAAVTNDLLDLLGGMDVVTTSAPAAPASAASALDDLLGGLTVPVAPVAAAFHAAPAPAVAVGGALDLLDMLGGGAPPPPVAAPAPAVQDPFAALMGDVPTPMPSSPAFAPIVAWQADGLSATFAFNKPPGQPASTEITATYTNSSTTPVSDFNLQAAVPKFMQLLLEPATGSVLPPFNGGKVQQRLRITNSMHGQKPLVMRLRISYTAGGNPIVQQAEVSNFPPGL